MLPALELVSYLVNANKPNSGSYNQMQASCTACLCIVQYWYRHKLDTIIGIVYMADLQATQLVTKFSHQYDTTIHANQLVQLCVSDSLEILLT